MMGRKMKTDSYYRIKVDGVKLGALLKKKREETDYSLYLVSNFMGISKTALWTYENGKRIPSTGILLKLCKLYHIEMEELYDVIA